MNNTWVVDPSDQWLKENEDKLPRAHPNAEQCPQELLREHRCTLVSGHAGSHAVLIDKVEVTD